MAKDIGFDKRDYTNMSHDGYDDFGNYDNENDEVIYDYEDELFQEINDELLFQVKETLTKAQADLYYPSCLNGINLEGLSQKILLLCSVY